jgi:phosphoribosylformylglycinamidine cyclo-ligase
MPQALQSLHPSEAAKRHLNSADQTLSEGRPRHHAYHSTKKEVPPCPNFAAAEQHLGAAIVIRDMNTNHPMSAHTAYLEAGVDTDEAEVGLKRLTQRITRNWPSAHKFGGVQLDIGYFANVINIGGIGLAICTDGVGSKAIIATLLNKYDTIGIDCVAMNVNDLICVGAKPISMVDYIAFEHVNATILEAISIGLTDGAEQADISISGGETAQLEDVIHGFDLAGTAVGTVPLDKILTGRNIEPSDVIIGIESNGIHSNGLTLARKAFFKREPPLPLNYPLPDLNTSLGEELIRPTYIYVREIMEIIEKISDVKALINITSDGLLNLCRVENRRVGFLIDEMPSTPVIFNLIKDFGSVSTGEMYEVYNMGVGFCVVVPQREESMVKSIIAKHGKKSWTIGRVTEERPGMVYLPRQGLVGSKKRFFEERF